VAKLVAALHLRLRVRFPMAILQFLVKLILLAVLWPWDDSGMSRGGKGGRSLGLRTMPTSCADCLEILGAALRACPGMYRDSFTFTLYQ
jgi:hypothetical protein